MSFQNAVLAREYLTAIASLGSPADVLRFYDPSIKIHEFPSRIAPNGRTRTLADLSVPYDHARQILRAQSFTVTNLVEQGNKVAMELVWRGTLAVPVLGLAAGDELIASVAMFLEFRDGKIVEQRSYDCYPPFGAKKDA